jgi:DNA-binding response OmpR family regulator
MGGSKWTVLVVDDNEGLQEAIKTVFDDDFEVLASTTGEGAVVLAGGTGTGIRVILLDDQLGGLHGADVLPRLKKLLPGAAVIMTGSLMDPAQAGVGRYKDVVAVLPKPWNVVELRATVRGLCS